MLRQALKISLSPNGEFSNSYIITQKIGKDNKFFGFFFNFRCKNKVFRAVGIPAPFTAR